MLKKLTTILLMSALLFGRGAYYVHAVEAPSAPEAPEAPEAPSSPESPDNTEQPVSNEAPTAPEAEPATEAAGGPEITPSPTPEQTLSILNVNNEGTNSNGNVGDTAINTGDANTTGGILNTANSNFSTSGCCGDGSGGGTSISNTDNGTSSDNNGSATVVNNNNTDQYNSAVVLNGMTQMSISGDNSASYNVGDSSITTGDANTTGTVITAANTNVEGLSISEFNIVGDHTGDYILDFGANCILGCTGDNLAITNEGNGSDSTNTGTIDSTTNNTTNQTNDGTVLNDVNLTANSGSNNANYNTGGDTSITTGDANVAANLLTFLNNNIAGDVIYGVVNIFGNLVGDIILPENVFDQFACSSCVTDANLTNSGNGTSSDNNTSLGSTTNNDINQFNVADIQNNLTLNAYTGGNDTNYNTGGSNSIDTGNTTIDASVLNLANLNLLGGNMWLVIVNEAGNWFGKIIGADGSMIASIGLNLFQDPDSGQINVSNEGNGSGSTNNGDVTTQTNNTLNQTNNGTVVNNLNLSANTGYNDANYNTGGNVKIETGDATVLANLINFVNNNIAGGKLLVAFVNVFGSWTGDLVTPGNPKAAAQVTNSGGSNNSSNQSATSASNNSLPNPITAVAGVFSNNFNQPSYSGGSDNYASVSVAGISGPDILSVVKKAATEKQNFELNLAWIVFALPVLGLAIVGRKFYKRGQLPKVS